MNEVGAMIEIVSTKAGLERCWKIRQAVFVTEQNVPVEEEIDAIDSLDTTIHLIFVRDGVDLGTARIVAEAPGHCHIGRVAVLKEARGTGAGKALMNAGAKVASEQLADSNGNLTIEISAQEHAISFYEGCGYQLVAGERYLDAGIWHRDMTLKVKLGQAEAGAGLVDSPGRGR